MAFLTALPYCLLVSYCKLVFAVCSLTELLVAVGEPTPAGLSLFVCVGDPASVFTAYELAVKGIPGRLSNSALFRLLSFVSEG